MTKVSIAALRILLVVISVPFFAFAGGSSDGGGLGLYAASEETVENLFDGLAQGLRYSTMPTSWIGRQTNGWSIESIASAIEAVEFSNKRSFRAVKGMKQELMLDYASDADSARYNPKRDKLVVRPAFSAMLGMRRIQDLSGIELKRIQISILHELSHLFGIGTKKDGSDDYLAQNNAEDIYRKMEMIDTYICPIRSAASPMLATVYVINTLLGTWKEYAVQAKNINDAGSVLQAFDDYVWKNQKSFARIVSSERGLETLKHGTVFRALGNELPDLSLDADIMSLSIELNRKTLMAEIMSTRTNGEKQSVQCAVWYKDMRDLEIPKETKTFIPYRQRSNLKSIDAATLTGKYKGLDVSQRTCEVTFRRTKPGLLAVRMADSNVYSWMKEFRSGDSFQLRPYDSPEAKLDAILATLNSGTEGRTPRFEISYPTNWVPNSLALTLYKAAGDRCLDVYVSTSLTSPVNQGGCSINLENRSEGCVPDDSW